MVTGVATQEAPCSPSFTVLVDIEEPHAPVTKIEARLGAGDWRDDAPLVVAAPTTEPPWILEVRAANAAGLVSASVALEVCTPELPETAEDPSDTSGADLPAATDGGGGGGGCGAGAPVTSWLAIVLGLSIPVLRRRRRHA
jgi:hypothetical protein